MILGWDACVRVPTCTFFNRSVGCRGGSGGVTPLSPSFIHVTLTGGGGVASALGRPPRATGFDMTLPLSLTCTRSLASEAM